MILVVGVALLMLGAFRKGAVLHRDLLLRRALSCGQSQTFDGFFMVDTFARFLKMLMLSAGDRLMSDDS
ncbi:MAG: hypothetical protein QM722_01575 [Piscinibacter sp.]